MLPETAVMVVVPADIGVTIPAVLIVATDVVVVLQVTCVVKFCVALFENVPVAVNCWVALLTMLGLAGVTAMDASVAIVSVAEPDMPPEAAVMVVDPSATDVARPALLMVALPVSDELHVT